MPVRLILLVAVVAIAFAAAANSTEPAAAPNASSRPADSGPPGAMPGGENGSKVSDRLREDTKLIDVVGTFQSAGGDSISFSREGGKDSLKVLENLNLQRISQVLEENRGGTRRWVVSGIVTEFRGANYLLVKKFVQAEEKDAAAK